MKGGWGGVCGLAVGGVEERVACSEGEDSYGWALVDTEVVLDVVYYR